MGCHEKELSVLFTDDTHMARLNARYLGRDGPTDVIAFPMSGGPPPSVETKLLGDVVISVDRAVEDAQRFEEALEITVYRLLIHGILHLLDYDHETSSEEAERMEGEQERLLAMIEKEDG